MKKVRAHVIFSAFIYLWALNCLAVKDYSGELYCAITDINPNAVKQAIVDGADVNHYVGMDEIPLNHAIECAIIATMKGNLSERRAAFKIVMLLIEAGAHVNNKDQDDLGYRVLLCKQ